MATWSREVFAKNLRHYMERSGKMQKELAEVAGVSPATFNDWLKAKKFPRIDRIDRLADYFGILKSDLIEEKTIDNSPTEMAELHFEMVTDEDYVEMFPYFRKLNAVERKLIKDLAYNLAEQKKEA